jgi:TolA-binding protein
VTSSTCRQTARSRAESSEPRARACSGRAKTRALAALLALLLAAGCAGLPGASSEQREAYRTAESVAESDPEQARLRFETFLREWPQSPLAPQARMRLG